MAKSNVLDFLYREQKSPLEFNFDALTAPPLMSLFTYEDIYNLNSIARSVKLSGKIKEKYRLIDKIMTSRGFVKLHAGTNRVVYRFIEDQRFVVKVAVDRVGLGDNPAEFQNQFLLKPFVTKVFEVTSCGTLGIFERVDAIMSREEFMSVADDIFNLITKFFVGKYILEDIGTHYFLNWGIRSGRGSNNNFGPVLLDFPYVFELDGNKLYCTNHPPGRKDIICGGQLDYDDGFNNLICTKCGKLYHARDLSKKGKDEVIIVGGKKTMKLKVKVGNEVILDSTKTSMSKVIEPPTPVVSKERTSGSGLKVRVNIPEEYIYRKEKVEEVVEETPIVEPGVVEETTSNEYKSVEVEQISLLDNEEKVDSVGELADYVDGHYSDISEDEEESIENEQDEEYDDEDDSDAVDYGQYMNNRQYNEMKNEHRHSKKKGNNRKNNRNNNFDNY